MTHCLDGCGHIGWSHAPALVPEHYGTDSRVAEATALETAERRARATMVLTQVTPSTLPTQVIVPRGVRRRQGA